MQNQWLGRACVLLVAGLLAVHSAHGAVPATCAPNDCADLVVVNAKIVTMAVTDEMDQAMAVRDHKIIALGSDAAVRRMIGVKTKVVDAGGHPVYPGFIDVHTHLDAIADYQALLSIHMPPLKSLDEVLSRIQGEARRLGPGKWVVAVGGWGQPMPTRTQLDQIAPDNPVVVRESIHAQVLNSRALAEIGIDRNFKTPIGGRIDRDADGNPTGRIQELFYLWHAKLPRPSYTERKAQLLRVLHQFAANGVTTIGDFPQGASMKIYQELHDANALPVRLRFNLFMSGKGKISGAGFDNHKEASTQVVDDYDDIMLNAGPRTGFGDDWLRIGCAKFFIDGETLSAVRYDPPGQRETWKGDLRISQAEIDAFVSKAHRAGWQICTHAMGDKAQDMILEALTKAETAFPRQDARHRIEHMGINEAGDTRRDQLEQAKALGVLPIVTPAWIYLGPEAFKTMHGTPFIYRTLVDMGFPIPGNSDSAGSMPTSTNPLFSIWTMVARKTNTGRLLAPEQAVTVKEALRGYMLDSAYAEFTEKRKGSLEPGKLADFVILSADPRKVATDDIKGIRVLKTFVGGTMTFQAGTN